MQNLTGLFGSEFENLDEKKKEEFLRSCISDLHNALVATEAYNSLFTNKSVNQDEQRSKNIQYGDYNPAHSMIFKTFQPSISYEKSKDYYEQEMNSTAMIGGFVEEYPFHRMLIKTFEQFSDHVSEVDENTDMLVEFWEKNRNPIFANYVAEALTNQNPNRAANKLLELLHNDKTDKKNAISAILYRLKFGRLGISKDGIRYLERQYDLYCLSPAVLWVNYEK